jgi:mannose-6-phosphate isomerase-like protein (cupin superfamily)
MSSSPFDKQRVDRVSKPWGYELIWSRTGRYVGKVLHINAGESLSRQYHRIKDETLFLIAGRVRLHLSAGGESRDVIMEVGDSYHIVPGLIHQIEALEDSDIVEVSTPELDDVVRLEDRYGRAGTSEP